MKKWIIQNRRLLLSALLLSVVIGLYAPFELYAVNRNDLWYTIGDFWYMPVFCSVALLIGCITVGLLLPGRLRCIYEGIVSGIGFAAWMQGTFGVLEFGEMDGHAIAWNEYQAEFLVDGLLWLLCIGICMIVCLSKGERIRQILEGAAAFISAMLLFSLVLLLVPCIHENKANPNGYATEKNLLNLSGNGDILVFLVDMTDEDFLEQMIAETPDIAQSLDGFVYYSNMSACYAKTRWSIPYLFSGSWLRRGDPSEEVNEICEEERIYWDELQDKGYEFGLYTDNDLAPERMKENANNYVKADFKITDKKKFLVTLYQFVACKYAPDMVKPMVWLKGYEFEERKRLESEYSCWTCYNLTLRDAMEREQLQVTMEKPQYKFIHISGSHAPHSNDEYGERVAEDTDLITCTKGAFRLIGRYMEQMRDADVFDSSSIIIMADHGDHQGYPTSPCFLVKQANSKGTLRESSVPVSHTDYMATVLELAGIAHEAYGRSVFDIQEKEVRERLYYMASGYYEDGLGNARWKLIEYEVDSEDNKTENYVATGIEYDHEGKLMTGVPEN